MTQEEYTQKSKQINDLSLELYNETHNLWEQAEIAQYKGPHYQTFKDYVRTNIVSICNSYNYLQGIEVAADHAGFFNKKNPDYIDTKS